jgi:uncharacterized protein (TIGR02265 family)
MVSSVFSSNSTSSTTTFGYAPPDLTRPLDVDAWLRTLPANATCKGLVAESILDSVPGTKLTDVKFASFREYPLRDILELKVAAARVLRPDAPLREGIAVVGQALFPKFVSTLLGRVMYGVFGGNVSSILRMANKSYEQTQNLGRVETTVVSATSVRMHFTNCWTFLDSYHVGVVQGTLAACKVAGVVHVKMDSDIEGTLLVEWKPRAR